MMAQQQVLLSKKEFNMQHTFESAQPLTFFGDYDKKAGIISYPYAGVMVRVGRNGRVVGDYSNLKKAVEADVYRRFRAWEDIKDVYSKIGTDPFIEGGINEYYGMRLTHNLPWETTLTFIISQFNNVKRIRQITKRLMEVHGQPVFSTDGAVAGKGIPDQETLAHATEESIAKCGAGFRTKYIRSAAEYCSYSLDLEKLGKLGYEELKAELMEIDGVGDKVADCIALMGYGKLEAFPIDTWIKRLIEAAYFGGKKTGIAKIHEFARERWGEYAGYAQQYIFWYGRNWWKKWNSGKA
ncbi:MAG: hypothetical protein QXN59_03140 [Candidatus Micrarchaeaceae archaeon]